MAWTVNPDDISEELQKYIGDNLWLNPKSIIGVGSQPNAFQGFKLVENQLKLPYFIGRQLELPRIRTGESPISAFEFTGVLRENQIEMIDEVFSHFNDYNTANLNAYCSAGKTVMASYSAAMISQVVEGPIIVVYSLKTLEPQWLSTFKEFTTANVCVIRSKAEAIKAPKAQVYLVMIDALAALPESIRLGCGLLVVDEAHLFCTKIRLDHLLEIEPKYLLLLTATREKLNGLHLILDFLAGEHTVIRKAPIPLTVICHETGIEPKYEQNKMGKVDWAKLVGWLSKSSPRNEIIKEWVRLNPHHKIAILTSRVEHAEILADLISHEEPVSLLCGKRKSYENSRILIGTMSKMGTGFDEKSNCVDFDGERINLLLLVISTKQVEQLAGRAFRAQNPTVIHLVDSGNLFKRHFSECKKFYKSMDSGRTPVVFKSVQKPEFLSE